MESLKNNWEEHKIEKKYTKLLTSFKTNGPTQSNIKDLNNLDKQITEMMIHAETKCTNVSSHHPDFWSPDLSAAIKNRRFWRAEKRRASKVKIGQSLFDAIENFKTACRHLKEAEKKYNEIVKDSKSIRVEFLQKLAADLAVEKGTEASNELKKLIHIEKQRNQAESTRKVLKPGNMGGLSSILIPSATEYDNSGDDNFDLYNINQMWTKIQKQYGHDIKNWDRVTERTMMEKLILAWQRKHFEQANETPLAKKEWSELFDDETIQQAIQDGTFDIPLSIPKETQQLIKQMRR